MSEGWAYNFSEVGEPTADAPAVPESQKATTISKNCTRQNRGEILRLKEEGTFHFLYAGDEGAIVHEYANYHDNAPHHIPPDEKVKTGNQTGWNIGAQADAEAMEGCLASM